MRIQSYLTVVVLAIIVPGPLAAINAASGAENDRPPWQEAYAGHEATGEHVIALWQFKPGDEAKDNSEHGHNLTLRGQAQFVPAGRFGACLESFPPGENLDKPQGAVAKNHPDLSPPGAFTLEMWLKPKPEMNQCQTAFLLDKKYYHYAKDLPRANNDYCLLMRRTGENQWRIVANLGYGKDSAVYTSRAVQLQPAQWYHVAFTYDGAGTGRFFFDGKPIGRVTHEGRGPVTAGNYNLVIGDRYGSNYQGLPAYVDQVRICRGVVPFFSGALEVDVAGARTVLVRMEKDAHIPVTIFNDTGRVLTDVSASIDLGGHCEKLAVAKVEPGGKATIQVSVDTSLRPGKYLLKVAVSANAGANQHEAKKTITVVIVARRLPHQMPVVMWGTGDLATVSKIGFTHQLVHLTDYGKIWTDGEPTDAGTSGQLAEFATLLDEHLAHGIGAVVYVYPAQWVMRDEQRKKQYQRIDRSGKPYDRENACARFPDLNSFAGNVGASVAKSFGHFLALQAALVHSEIRDGTNLCFHSHDREAYHKFSGHDIPAEAVSRAGVDYSKIEGFPAIRVVPDDHRLLAFYRWFWKQGDGWNALHTQVHKGLKSTGRDDLWTFFDPAVRVPSVWGSGGGVDVISQWTYSYPDPIKIGQAADELFAMGDGAPHKQQVMKMTQVIWYRSQTAPKLPEDASKQAPWEREIPDARFITIAPDQLREAFWSKLSRPVRGIMYHGWGSLVDAGKGGYQYTNSETREVLAELIRDVVRPLGPTLLQVPDRKADVALLESFASQVFARRGSWGWGKSWEADMHLILQWAQIQPQVVYDETILRDGLDQFRVLVMPHCDVLTESVAQQVLQFQSRGGIVVGDEQLCPVIRPDILVQSYRRTGKADEDKMALQAVAAGLRQQLDSKYRRYGDSTDPDVVVRFRRYRDADYLFAVNDKRTFGDYVGHHGKVMEKGLPASATLSVQRPGGYVYDLVTHSPVKTEVANGQLKFQARLGPGDGRVFLITDRKITDVVLEMPETAYLGKPVELRIAVVDDQQEPIACVVPVRVEILDAENNPAEFGGYYGTRDGRLSINLDLAPNDATGQWTVRVTELASGLSRERKLAVRSPNGDS